MRGDDDEGVRSASSPPADELRCIRNDGKEWRCKGRKYAHSSMCEHHYLQIREKNLKRKVDAVDKASLHPPQKRSRPQKHGVSSSAHEEEEEEEEEEEIPLRRRTHQRGLGMKERRDEKMKMEKEEAEKSVLHWKEELDIYEKICEDLSNELEKKKKEIIDVVGKLEELEMKNIDCEIELQGSNVTCHELRKQIGWLEKDIAVACQRERKLEERFVKKSRDERDGFEEAIRKAENEVGVWKRRFQDLQSQVLLESQIAGKKKICDQKVYPSDYIYRSPHKEGAVAQIADGIRIDDSIIIDIVD